MTTHTPVLDSELERIGETFATHERAEFLCYVWSTEFAESDKFATTDESVKRANEVEARAAYLWDRNGGFRNCC